MLTNQLRTNRDFPFRWHQERSSFRFSSPLSDHHSTISDVKFVVQQTIVEKTQTYYERWCNNRKKINSWLNIVTRSSFATKEKTKPIIVNRFPCFTPGELFLAPLDEIGTSIRLFLTWSKFNTTDKDNGNEKKLRDIWAFLQNWLRQIYIMISVKISFRNSTLDIWSIHLDNNSNIAKYLDASVAQFRYNASLTRAIETSELMAEHLFSYGLSILQRLRPTISRTEKRLDADDREMCDL